MTQLADILNPDDLQQGIADGFISCKDSDCGYTIHCYTNHATYTKGAWNNPAVRMARGLIVDHNTGRVIARPWAKFFNYGDPLAADINPDEPARITDKLDGSLGIIYRDMSGFPMVATKGSFDSPQAQHATRWLQKTGWQLDNLEHITPLVEIIYPANRIVLDYGDRDELVLLGGVAIQTGVYLSAHETAMRIGWKGSQVETLTPGMIGGSCTLMDALCALPRPNAEGYCVQALNQPAAIVKVKEPEYLRLHKIVSGLSERSVWRALCDGLTVDDMLADLPDEFHDWVKQTWQDIDHPALIIERDAKEHAARISGEVGDDRKAFAEQAKECAFPWAVFAALDGKDVYRMALTKLEPKAKDSA